METTSDILPRPNSIVLLLQRSVLRANKEGCHGLTSVACHSQFLQGRLWERSIQRDRYKSVCSFRYIDGTYVILTHRPEKRDDFPTHVNSTRLNIQFTMETKLDNQLSFLGIDIYRRSDSSLGHTVYRKPTYIDLYLNAKSRHHSTNMHSMFGTLLHRTRDLRPVESPRGNGLPSYHVQTERLQWQINPALHPPQNEDEHTQDSTSADFMPYVGSTFSRISRALLIHNINTVGLPLWRSQVSFDLWKIPLALKQLSCRAPPANMTRSTLDRPGVPSRPGWKSTTGTRDFTIRINQPWQSTASTGVTKSSLTTPVS